MTGIASHQDLLAKFGITDIDKDGTITAWEQKAGETSELAYLVARTSHTGSTDEIDEIDTIAIRKALEANLVFKESILKGAATSDIKCAAVYLAQLDEAKSLFAERLAAYAEAHPLLSYIDDGHRYSDLSGLGVSKDPGDKWLASAISGVALFLWPDSRDASNALSTHIRVEGEITKRPTYIGPEVVAQLHDAVLDKVLNP